MSDANMDLEPLAAPVGMPNDWTIHKSASLVRDIAQNLYDIPVILEKHGLTQEQYDRLKDNEFFKKAVDATILEWNAPQNTKKRLALEAAIAIEDSLPEVVARMKTKNEPLTGVVQLLKLLSDMAGTTGVTAQSQPGAASAQFRITFNLGADTAAFQKKAPMIDVTQNKEITYDAPASDG